MTKLALATIFALTVTARADTPETVLSIDRPKQGKEEELLRAIRDAHAAEVRLGLVVGPHFMFRARDAGGKPLVIQLFTWKSAEIPDHVPAEIKKIWDRMQAAVEKRDGRPGIEFYAVEPIEDEPAKPK